MAATSFSYAQAAQGTATPSPTGTPPPQETATIPLPSAIDWASAVEMDDDDFSAPAPASAAKETTASQEPAVKEKVTAVYAAEALPSETANKEPTTSTTDAPAAEDAPTYLYYRAPAAERQDWESTVGSEADSTSYPSFRRRSDSRREEDPGRLERPWRRADRGSMSGSIDEENRPGRLVKKFGRGGDKSSKTANAEKVQEEAEPKGELLEAPIPSFNPWTQRKDSTTTKAKLVLASAATTAAAATASNTASAQPAKATTASSETSAAPSDSTADKSVDSAVNGVAKPPARKWGELPPRNGARGARVGDKDGKNGLTANDDIAWPTPETAVQEEKKKAATAAPAAEKVERSDKDSTDESAPAKSRPKEKWVAYDYVPTVSFETQLPQMRGSKPRGGARAVNGTRPAGAAGQAGDKVPAAQTNKSAESRNRRESSNGASRTASLPPTNKRASLDGTQLREPRKVSNPSSGDKAKDPAATSAAAAAQNWRERSDNAPNGRGRGGYRGRGGHHNLGANSGVNTNGPAVNGQSQSPHIPSGFNAHNAGSRPQGPYSPPPRQNSQGQMFMPPSQRGGRGGRNGANNYHRMSLPNNATRIPPLQMHYGGPYDYPMAPMSAMPFQPQPYWDHMVVNMLRSQIEYYFSIENLCKDMYLRARMDSQGFVPMHFIAAFKRVRTMSTDIAMVRAVCESSSELDLVVGEDDLERVRRRDGWEKWLLPMEERDEFARNSGPARLTFKNRPFNMNQQFNAMQLMGYAPNYGSPTDMSMQQQQQQLYVDPQQQQAAASPVVNGSSNGDVSKAASQLSANVPDFAPSVSSPIVNGQHDTEATTNGVHAEEAEAAAEEAQS
ncbi:hypothetical protein VHEMI02384 [[Torrubiella] hemipterigena]|uniref:HTH La-type RNA-binding domain-containing protein n=1 Tax=[Torrubiella] hemipterigena TaxID=1531966 RepID=A0A0A1SPG4_9HYPO|nr:hypothetical protein VHEMI02384 [[Torrubiella] hemipterigena]